MVITMSTGNLIEFWTMIRSTIIKTNDIHPEGAIFARGACDDKGQMFMHPKAFEILQAEGGVPCT